MVSEEELAAVIGGWTKVNKKTRELLCKNTRKVAFSAGEELIQKGDVAFFFVKKGNVDVYIGSENGDEVFLYRVSKEEGCAVSEELAYEFPTAAEMFVLDSVGYETALQSATVASFFLRTERKQKEKVFAQVNAVLFTGVEKRLADFLLLTSARNKGKPIAYTHEQIARFIGTSREVVTRKLKTFAEEGSVSLSRGKVIVLNREELRKKR